MTTISKRVKLDFIISQEVPDNLEEDPNYSNENQEAGLKEWLEEEFDHCTLSFNILEVTDE